MNKNRVKLLMAKPLKLKGVNKRRAKRMEVSVAKIATITGQRAKVMLKAKRMDTIDYKKEYEEMMKKYGVEEI